MVSIRNILPGEELLVDYGGNFPLPHSTTSFLQSISSHPFFPVSPRHIDSTVTSPSSHADPFSLDHVMSMTPSLNFQHHAVPTSPFVLDTDAGSISATEFEEEDYQSTSSPSPHHSAPPQQTNPKFQHNCVTSSPFHLGTDDGSISATECEEEDTQPASSPSPLPNAPRQRASYPTLVHTHTPPPLSFSLSLSLSLSFFFLSLSFYWFTRWACGSNFLRLV